MSTERISKMARTLSIARASLAGTAITLALGPLAVHPENSFRVINWLRGHNVDCTRGIEPQNSNQKADAIVVPGAGLILSEEGEYEPNIYGKIRLAGAAIAYSKGWASKIILLDGETNSEEARSASAKFLQEFYAKIETPEIPKGSKIPSGVIFLENQSKNTATNMERLSKLAPLIGVRSVLIITNDNHNERANLLACAHGINSFSIPAESLIDPEVDSELTEEIEKMHISEWDWFFEQVEIGLIYIDPEGDIPTLIKDLGIHKP